MNPLVRKNRKAVVITVFGKGTGKSLISAVLSRYLTRNGKKSAIILSTDIQIPMLSVFYPRERTLREDSLGNITDSAVIDNGIVAPHVKFTRKFPNIGVLAYAPGDNYTMYAPFSEKKAIDIINCAANLSSESADFLIVDTTSDVTNTFVRAAVEAADIVIYTIPPEERGIAYTKANLELFNNERYHESQWINVLTGLRPFHSTSAFNSIIPEGVDSTFPYSKDMEKAMVDGDIFDAGDSMLKWHLDFCRKVEEAADKAASTKDNNTVEIKMKEE